MATRSIVQNEDQFCIYRSVESSGARVLWELTSACNLKCGFCLVEIKRRHLSVEKALAVADGLIEAGVGKVMISGGEPLLHPGAEAILDRLSSGDVLVKLLTNGTIHRRPVIDLIAGRTNIEVSVSVPSADPALADEIFAAPGALAKIGTFLAALPRQRVNAICAVSRGNLAGVEGVIDWVADRGLACVSLTDIFKDPTSPARFHADCRDQAIGVAERAELFAIIARKRAQYAGRLAIRTTQFLMSKSESCGAGQSVFYVDALGRVAPCSVTENRAWREATQGMGVAEAIDFYRRTVTAAPTSSCSARLAAAA
jgi:MoaA/NifB/PqqE/SkfB family radical SAM enzyme